MKSQDETSVDFAVDARVVVACAADNRQKAPLRLQTLSALHLLLADTRDPSTKNMVHERAQLAVISRTQE